MVKTKQLPLPELELARFTVHKNPQPKTVKKVDIKKFEILHHPFDLGFRGRIKNWLSQFFSSKEQVAGSEENVECSKGNTRSSWKHVACSKGKKNEESSKRKNNTIEILSQKEFELLRLYFYPQGKKKKWLNQEEVLERTGIAYKKKLRDRLVETLLKIWKTEK